MTLYIVRSRNRPPEYGKFAVTISTARAAVEAAQAMIAKGVPDVEIIDKNGNEYSINQLEKIAKQCDVQRN